MAWLYRSGHKQTPKGVFNSLSASVAWILRPFGVPRTVIGAVRSIGTNPFAPTRPFDVCVEVRYSAKKNVAPISEYIEVWPDAKNST